MSLSVVRDSQTLTMIEEPIPYPNPRTCLITQPVKVPDMQDKLQNHLHKNGKI